MSVFVFFVFLVLAAFAGWFVWRRFRRNRQPAAPAMIDTPSETGNARDNQSGPATERWMVDLQGVPYGPFSFAQLQRFKADGILQPNLLLRAESDGATVAASALPGLFSMVPPPPDFAEQAVAFQAFVGERDALFSGSGRAKVSGGVLTLWGRPRTLFVWRKRKHEIPLNQIRDVAVSGRLVKFAVDEQPGMRVLRMKSRADAQLLAQSLPKRESVTWAQVKQDNEEFSRFMGESRPWVTISIIAVNIVIFAAIGLGGGGWSKAKISVLAALGGNLGILTTQGEWWRLVTNVFLHSGLMHVAVNMAAFWEAGRVTERLFGHIRYLVVYLLVGTMASIASINWHQDVVSVGASGAIFGIYGVLLAALVLDHSLLPPTVTQRLRKGALIFVGYALMQSFGQSGVDHAAHIGGLLAGLMLGAALVMPRGRAWAVGTLALVLALGGVWLGREASLPYADEVAFRTQLPSMLSEEQRLVERSKDILTVSTNLQAAMVADRIDRELLPDWKHLLDQLAAMNHLLPATQALHAPLLAYVRLKYESLGLIRDALRNEDEAMLHLANARVKEANAQAAEFKRRIDSTKAAQPQQGNSR